jgi:hypothetical protein
MVNIMIKILFFFLFFENYYELSFISSRLHFGNWPIFFTAIINNVLRCVRCSPSPKICRFKIQALFFKFRCNLSAWVIALFKVDLDPASAHTLFIW